MKTKMMLLTAITVSSIFTGCKKDEPEPDTTSPSSSTTYSNGVFVTNEGPFGSGTGTLSFISRSGSSAYNNIFEAKNSFPLGNIVQSMAVFNNKGYIVVNNAGKVEVVDANTMATARTIGGFTYPRYFLGIDNTKAYVTEWGAGGVAGAVKVIDLNTKSVTATINTGKGAENMVKVGNKVFVACGGGYDNDSVVTVIDALTDAIDTTIYVGPNPSNLQVDVNGNVWVLCKGKYNSSWTALEQSGKLVRLNGTNYSTELAVSFASTSSQPGNLVINAAKTNLYYSYTGKVFEHSITATVLNSTATINRNFYGLGLDPVNDQFYGSDAVDFSSNGKVIRYTVAGAVIDSFTVGVIPGNFCFK